MPELMQQGARPIIRLAANSNDPWQDFAELRLAVRNPDGTIEIAKRIEWETMPENTSGFTEPLMTVSLKTAEGTTALRLLMDQLWALGIRPTEQGTPGQLAATERHLEDMRRLVAKAYDAPLKPTSSI